MWVLLPVGFMQQMRAHRPLLSLGQRQNSGGYAPATRHSIVEAVNDRLSPQATTDWLEPLGLYTQKSA